MVEVLIAIPNNKAHNFGGLSCHYVFAKRWQMKQNVVVTVNTKSRMGLRLVNISRFEHIAK